MRFMVACCIFLLPPIPTSHYFDEDTVADDTQKREISKRFEWFVSLFGDPAKFINRFGFSPSQIYRLLNGTSIPKLDTAVLISERTGINIQWWGSGEGNWWANNEAGRKVATRHGAITEHEGELVPVRVAGSEVPVYTKEQILELMQRTLEELSHTSQPSNE
jgi:hypothetical protein